MHTGVDTAIFGFVIPQAVVTDQQGNAYVAGYTTASDLPVSPDVVQPYLSGAEDAFAAKFDRHGSLIWLTYLGGSSGDYALGIAVNLRGQVIVTGGTASGDFPLKDAIQPAYGGTTDAFVTVLAPDARTIVSSTYLGGSQYEAAQAIALASNGTIHIVGQASSPDFPTTGDPAYLGGPTDAFVASFDSTATHLLASHLLGGADRDVATDVAVDPMDRLIVVGTTQSSNFPVLRALQQSFRGNQDAFVTVLEPEHHLAWSTYLGSSAYEPSVATDAKGRVYVALMTNASDLPVRRAAQPTFGGSLDAYLAKIDIDRSRLIFATYLGGNDLEVNVDVAVDERGRAYVTTHSESDNYPLVRAIPGADMLTTVTTFNESGASIVYSTRILGLHEAADSVHAIAVDSDGSAIVTGNTSGFFLTKIEQLPEREWDK